MAKRLQHRGGTTAQHSTFTGAVREVTVDTDKNTLVVHDGATAGGHPLATATNFTSTGIDDNATSTAITIDSNENIGFKTTNIDNNASYATLRLGTTGAIWAYTPTSNGNLYISENISKQGGTRIRGDFASSYGQTGGEHLWYTAPYGSAGSAVTLSEAMRIDSSGNVGIGTSSPANNLDIVDDAIGDIGINITNTTRSNGGHSASVNLISENLNTDLSDATKGAIFVGGDLNGNNFQEFAIATESNTPIVFVTNGDGDRSNGTLTNERMRITSSGNVGIGTTSPDELLTVALSGSTGTYFRGGGTADSSNARRLRFTSSTTTNAGDTHTLNAESATGNIAFAINNTERMRIDSSGKVGINTTSPDSTFHVGNSTDTSEYITLQSSGDKRLGFKGASATRAEIGVYEANHNDLVLRAFSSAGIRFVTNGENFSGNGANPIRIDTNGYLGIGTNSPSQRLDVDGSIEVSGGIYIGGTGIANRLDDYEEGTWTPAINAGVTSPTYSNQQGTYTKIGRMVYFNFDLRTSGGTLVAGDFTLNGLPFTNSSDGAVDNGGAHFVYTLDVTTETGKNLPTINIVNNSTTINLYGVDGNRWNGTDMQNNTFVIIASGCYQTD